VLAITKSNTFSMVPGAVIPQVGVVLLT